MNIFGLDGVGLLLTLAMSLLISGLIMFYSLRRFKMLENSIVEQGKVLQSFILKSQNQIEHGLASPIAVDSAIVQSETNRIEVSDDDNSEDEDSEDDDSDDDDSQDEPEDQSDENESIEEIENKLEGGSNELNIDEVLTNEIKDSIEKSLVEEDLVENLDETIGLKIVEVENSEIANDFDDLDKDSKKIPGLTKLKVTELRDLAIEKNLDTTDNINKLKKEQLIKLLNEKLI